MQRLRTLRPLLAVLVAAPSIAALGCSNDEAAPARCTPDAVVLAKARACVRDDQCACGAHCALGECVSECGVGAPGASCASGDTCDSFGRCRKPGDTGSIATLAAGTQGDLRVETPSLRIAPGAIGSLRLGAATRDVGPIRVVASAGYELSCANDGAGWASVCRDPALPLGRERVIGVRAAGATAPGTINVYSFARSATVSVSVGTPAPVTGLAPGVYAGVATLVDAAITHPTLPSAPAGTAGTVTLPAEVPISAQLFASGTGSVVSITDPLHALNVAGQWVGALQPTSAANGTATFPRTLVEGGALTGTMKTEVLGKSVGATYASSPNGASLTVTLPIEHTGMLASERAPRLTWQLSLVRTGDVPPGAVTPTVPVDVSPTLAATSANDASDWFLAQAALYEPLTAGFPDPTASQVLSTWTPTSGAADAPRRLDACTSGGRELAAVTADKSEWRAASLDNPSPIAPSFVDPKVREGNQTLLGVALDAVAATYVRSASVANVSTTSLAGTVACAADFEPASVYCYDGTPNTGSLQLRSVDRCAELAARYECIVEPGTGTMNFSLHLDTTNNIATSSCASNVSTSVTGHVTKVCRLRSVAWNCGELVSCVGDDGRVSYSPTKSPLAIGGDLPCGAGTSTIATVADRDRNDPANTDTVSRVVENVLADFARLAQPAKAPFPAAAGFDAPRVLVALEYATEIDRARAGDATIPPSPGATRYAARLVQEWATSAALIASEAHQRARVPDATIGAVPDPAFPSRATALARSLDAWAVLLHPRFATALSAMDGATLAAPDYRADFGATVAPDPSYTQTDGLPIALFDALRAQLSLLDVVLYKGHLAGDPTVLALAGRTLRDALLVQAIARDLFGRIVVATPNPPWLAKYNQADAALSHTLQTAMARAARFVAGKNPIGIEDEDLPLYFSGVTPDAASRFSAISDYLLGSGAKEGTGFASAAITQAKGAADALGAAYKEQVTRRYQSAVSTTEQAARVDAVRSAYGTQLSNLCGLPSGVTSQDALEKWTTFDSRRCYFASDLPQCRVDQAAIDALLDRDTVLNRMCVARTLAAAIPSVAFSNATLNRALFATVQDNSVQCTYDILNCSKPGAEPGPTGCLKCNDVVTDPLTVSALAGLDLSHVAGDQLTQAEDACRALHPGARPHLPGPDDGPASPIARPECYRGSLGDLAFSLRGAAKDIDIARSAYADHLDAYNIAMNSCFIKVAANQKLDALRARHDAVVSGLRDTKADHDKGAAIALGVMNCANSIVCATGTSPAAAPAAVAATAVACGAAIAQSVEQVASIDTQRKLDAVEDEYQSAITEIAELTDVKTCMNEAHLELVGMRTAEQQIERAFIDFAHAENALSQGIGSAQQAYDEGRAAVLTAEGRSVRPPALDAWVDARVDDFVAAMSKARLMAYLAERAVEYEYQASFAARGRILSAELPSELDAAITDLRGTAGTQSIGGHRPSTLKVVLSLRDHLLQLWDASHASPAEQALDASERFKLLLRDPAYALYVNGAYAGQRIPFSLTPLGALHGDTKGIEIFAATDCAERIWSVNASILGTQALVKGAPTTFARMDLLKSNTFFSQWCAPQPTGAAPFQLASVRPSRNLFRDPDFGLAGPATSGGGVDPGTPPEVTQGSRARIQAYFNVTREAFEADTYANGETSELAARGLYGDYALFFPAGILSVPTRDASGAVTGFSDGLDLRAVDDILLRVDYVSVAR